MSFIGGTGTPKLSQLVVDCSKDMQGRQLTNLAAGVLPNDVATISQLTGNQVQDIIIFLTDCINRGEALELAAPEPPLLAEPLAQAWDQPELVSLLPLTPPAINVLAEVV